METKAKKENPEKNEDTKAKAETKRKDVAEPKANKKNSAKTTDKDKKDDNEFREFFIDELKIFYGQKKPGLKRSQKCAKLLPEKSWQNHSMPI